MATQANFKPVKQKPYKSRLGRGKGMTFEKIKSPNPKDKLTGKGPKPGLGPSAPAAPSKPALKPAPAAPDSGYNTDIDLINRQETSSLGQLGEQKTAIKHDFGIDDPTNPFSRAEGLKRSYLAQRKAASAGLASMGQGYSGAHERALKRVRFQEEEARSGLRAAYEQALGQVGSAETGVKFESEEARNKAFEDWLNRAGDADVALDEEPDGGIAPPAAGGGSNVLNDSAHIGNTGAGYTGIISDKGKVLTSGGNKSDPEGHRVSGGVKDPFAKGEALAKKKAAAKKKEASKKQAVIEKPKVKPQTKMTIKKKK